jgi:hypothetical protein
MARAQLLALPDYFCAPSKMLFNQFATMSNNNYYTRCSGANQRAHDVVNHGYAGNWMKWFGKR